MNKVYLLTRGEYSDYGVVAVFSTKENAEKFLKDYCFEWYSPQIEEYDLDSYVPMLKEHLYPYLVQMNKQGNSEIEELMKSDYELKQCMRGDIGFFNGRMYLHVLAKDTKHAAKIANERRTQLIANNKWGVDNE